MDKNKEYKTFPFEVKEISDDGEEFGIIKGYASTFGNVDDGNDRVISGAFSDFIKRCSERRKKIAMHMQHDSNSVVGGWKIYREDKNGLYVEGEINRKFEDGKKAHALAQQGVFAEMSIGYWAKEFNFVVENGKTIRNLTKIDIYEISLVTSPMNEKAIITDVKCITDISNILKMKGFSNKEANEIIYQIKSMSRKDDKDEARNEISSKVDSILFCNKIDELINKLKG